MNINELRKRQETAATTQNVTLTLGDLTGKKAVLPLPDGLFECKLTEINSAPTARAFVFTVEAAEVKDGSPEETTKPYRVSINIGNTSESASMFLSNISHFLDQLSLPEFDLDAIKGKIGETIVIYGQERISDRGTFLNYTFDPRIIAANL